MSREFCDKEKKRILAEQQENDKKIYLLTFTLIVLITAAAIYSLFIGSAQIEWRDIYGVIFSGSRGMVYNIIWNIRLPSILTSLIAGMGLALSGAVMQCILKNPLASPFTLGISHAAAFGAAFSIVVLDFSAVIENFAFLEGIYLPSAAAFLFSQIAVVIVLFISRQNRATAETIVLAGIALSSLFTAGTTALQFFADDLELASVIYWTFGDPGRTTWNQLLIITIVFVIITAYFIYQSWDYSILNAGDEVASSLGVDSAKLRLTAMTAASILTAVIISFVGIIGFIGLVTPHIIRKIAVGSQRQLFINSALAGGLLLIISDNLARTAFRPVVLPVGVLTAFLGAPLFIYLVIKGRQYW
ncbi:MAG: iron ABC transporter permease [Halanaerobium sp. MSAO_Bac5]|nr:MAG: iron ABC transporter permease [Halanaerobium sp. MSAO_Bac5]